MTYEDYKKLCEEIWHHNKLYYVDQKPIISDEEFDHLLKKLESIEKQHPDWISPTSPSQRVGESTLSFKTIEHSIPMLSLANTYSQDEIAEFIKRIHKLTGHRNVTFSCELKMDGVAISAAFKEGKFVQGVTRGDGRRGDDITTNMKTIEALPLELYGKHLPDFIEARGEVFMPHSVFKKLNEEKASMGEDLWANPRNAAAGSLKLLNPHEAAKRELGIVFYGIADMSPPGPSSQYDSHVYLKNLGLPILPHMAKCHNLEEIWQFAEHIRALRSSLPFDIDGVVIKLDNIKEQDNLGVAGKNPRWAVAYKFAAEQALTRIHAITVQVGRTGVLTPVAELDPMFLAGSTISRATLHNQEEVQRKDIRVGDYVYIEKGGDVIPKVDRVELSKRPSHSHPWKMPAHCPSCGSAVVKIKDEVAVRCPNAQNCREQQLLRIVYFASKPAMDIDNLGEKVVQHLFDKGFIRYPSDIYKLTAEQLYQLPNFKDKSVQNLLGAIDKSREVSLDKFIMALGIKYVGQGTAEDLAKASGEIQTMVSMSYEDLLRIEGVGEKVASAIIEHFQDPHNKSEIDLLLAYGVKPKWKNLQQRIVNHAFNGKIFVLTGSLLKYKRSEAAELIKERGGKVTESISKKTDYLIVGEDPGSKLDKARELGVEILTEENFEKLL